MAAHGLDGFSYFGLVVFVLSMVPVLYPFSIPLGSTLTRFLKSLAVYTRVLDPQSDPQVFEGGAQPEDSEDEKVSTHHASWRIPIGLTISPPLGVLLLLATTSIDGSVIRQGVVGDGAGKPYDVIVLFISLAYIATALDGTGALRALAFLVSQRGGQSGPRLYALLFLFFFACGVIFGNDPIILSGTAFLAYFTRVTGIAPPTAWIFMEFIAANVASAVLVSSNPTNVLLAQAFELNFLTGYTKYTVLPSVVCALVSLPLLYLMFCTIAPRLVAPPRRASPSVKSGVQYIPSVIDPPDVSPRSALIDPTRAIFQTSLMLITLGTLVGTSFVHGVQVWMVTAPGGIVGFLGDILHESLTNRRARRANATKGRPPPPSSPSGGRKADSPPDDIYPPPAPATQPARRTLQSLIRAIRHRYPMTTSTIAHLPIPLLPFALSMFILVRSLVYLGWVSIFAGWMADICTSVAATVFFVGFLGSLVLCPLFGTNIGATILLVQIFSDERFQRAPHVQADPRILRAAIFSTALASNIGAFSFTFAASLAGLLWVRILSQKHVHVSARAFAGWNALPVVTLTLVSCLVVWLEVIYF